MCREIPSEGSLQPHHSNATDQGLFLSPWGPGSDSWPQGSCWPSMSGMRAAETSTACSCSQSLSQLNHGLVLKDGTSRASCIYLTGEEMGLRETNASLKSWSWPYNPVS